MSMNCNNTGTKKPCVMRCLPMSVTISAGFTSRMMIDLQPSAMPAVAQPPPPMWKSGIATRLTVRSVNFQISAANGMSAKKLLLVSMTPFGLPVVPLEYN